MDKIKYLQTEEYIQYKAIMDVLQCIFEMFKENNYDCLPEELEAFKAFADDQV